MKYSLANYILSIDSNDPTIKNMFGAISIGGEGNYLGNIVVSIVNDMWSTNGYATGAWVHNKNLDRHGTVTVQLNQLSNQVAKFIQLCKIFYSGDYEGFTLSLSDINGNKIATGIDCYIQKIADQTYDSSASNQSWVFTCGQINYI